MPPDLVLLQVLPTLEAPGLDLNANGAVDCGDRLAVYTVVTVYYPTTDTGDLQPFAGTTTGPASTSSGYAYLSGSAALSGAALGILTNPVDINCGVGGCQAYSDHWTVLPDLCQVDVGFQHVVCRGFTSFQARRTAGCQQPALELDFAPDNGTFAATYPADFTGLPQPPCPGCGPTGVVTMHTSVSLIVPSQLVSYTVTAHNTGLSNAAGGVLQDLIPPSATFAATASAPGWTCAPDSNPGATCTLPLPSPFNAASAFATTFALNIGPDLPPGLFSNTACARLTGDTNPADDCTSLVLPIATLFRNGFESGDVGAWAP